MQSWVLGTVCSARAWQGAFPAELCGKASHPRPQTRRCGVQFLSPGNHKLLLLRKKPGGGGVGFPYFPCLVGVGGAYAPPTSPVCV